MLSFLKHSSHDRCISELSNSANVSRPDNVAAMWNTNVTDLDTGWTRFVLSNSSVHHYKTVESVGCPYEYKWCLDTPAVKLWQLLLGTFFIAIGYPTCNVMSYTIYSKLLGPKPQVRYLNTTLNVPSRGKTNIVSMRNVPTQISLRSLRRLIRIDTFRLRGIE